MRNLYMTLLVCFATLAMSACSRSEPTPSPGNTVKPAEPPTANVDVRMSNAFVEGTVKSSFGEPLEGVNITSGEATTTSDANGNFSFSRVADASGRFVLNFSKAGYFNVTRSGVIDDNVTINVVMQSKGGANTASVQFNAFESEIIETRGMQVNIPAKSLVTLDGREYSGTVQADMFYLSPDNADFTELMPGSDLAAVREDESEVTLISYGMVEVSLTDDGGNTLQLKEGERSEMTFPIPETMRDNPPPTIPLWYFDDESGLWVEEGIATLQGDVYVGEVGHFSWHNLDVPAERVSISGKVTDSRNRPVSRVIVTVEQTSAVTNANGEYSVYVPENTPVTVVVESEDYFNYSPEASVDVAGYPGGSVVRDVDLQLPRVPVISGRITDTSGNAILASIYCEYEANGITHTSDVAYSSSLTGEYALRLPLDISGSATFYIEPLGSDPITRVVELTGEDQTLNIEFDGTLSPIDGSVIQIKGPNGNTLFAATINPETAYAVIAEGAFSYLASFADSPESMFTVGVEMYDDSINSYNTASVTLLCMLNGVYHVFAAENSHVEITSVDNESISFVVIANGVYYTDTDTAEVEATLSATITSPLNKMNVDMLTNVTDWSSLKCAELIPELLTPIDLVAYISYMGIDVEALYYHATEAEADEVCSRLSSAGWSPIDEQPTEAGYTITYMDSSYAMVMVQYEPDGIEAPDENRYTLCVIPVTFL